MKANKMFLSIITFVIMIGMTLNFSFADNEKKDVDGCLYTFNEDSKYETFDNVENVSTNDEGTKTYGKFSVSGNVSDITSKDNVPAYIVKEGNVELFYNYSDDMYKGDEKAWHITSDDNKKILGKKYDAKIEEGAILIQTSKDRQNWSDVKYINNAFRETPIRTESIYTTTDMEMLNGAFYRVIVLYKSQKKLEPKNVLFMEFDNYEYKKNAEVYEFYISRNKEVKQDSLEQIYKLGNTVRTKEFKGYYGEKEIVKDKDPHYGWELGEFFVSGYTDKIVDKDGNPVFLKNVGDQVTLWFNLKQDINKLNNNDELLITPDHNGYDQTFQTEAINLGRGALIIKYTDRTNSANKPQIYTNYLEANAKVGANTMVQLFEEGDYEVALDYEITNKKFIDKVSHYRNSFKYSVRNGNCMVYLFDALNGNELTNSSMTENGFKIDLARSGYLKVNVRKEQLVDGSDEFVEDIRFNGPARDGFEYKDEGIYTITAVNEYTHQSTTKKIYVGKNNVIKAHMVSGLSIGEINKLVNDKGAVISNDGEILLEKLSNTEAKDTTSEIAQDVKQNEINNTESKKGNNIFVTVIIWIIVIVILVVIAIIVLRKFKVKELINKKANNNSHKSKVNNTPKKDESKANAVVVNEIESLEDYKENKLDDKKDEKGGEK